MELELQITYQYSELRALFWNFVLYWTSVSFGLMAASHVAAPKLHTAIVAMICLIYISFSVWLGFVFFTHNTMVNGFLDDLRAMGELSSQGAKAILAAHEMSNQSKIPIITIFFASIGTFLGTNIFLWYSHLKGRANA